MGIKIDPIREQAALIEAQQILVVLKNHGNLSPKKMKAWATEILEYYPNQGVIEEVWKDRIRLTTIAKIEGGKDV
jgi:hypothetical protein